MKHTAGRYVRLIGFAFANLLVMSACDPAAVKLRQFAVQGERLYLENCSNCHQAYGSGLALLYPPLTDAEILQHPERIACAIRYGASGPKQIGGKNFNQPMAPVENLTDLEVAEIITYLTTTWGSNALITDQAAVQKMVAGCR